MKNRKRFILLEPSSHHYQEDRLFDIENEHLNRDGTLLPFFRAAQEAKKNGHELHTADMFKTYGEEKPEYYSLGILDGNKKLQGVAGVNYSGFLIMEPPIVAPKLYAALPQLTAMYDCVYVHNTEGVGYSTEGVDMSKLKKFFWPMPYDDVQEPFWSHANRKNSIVVINGNHNPGFRLGEQYSTRIEAMAELAATGLIDLFGFGWKKWWSLKSLWLPYWRHRKKLMSIYKGSCRSKLETLSQYRFCLCFENMAMDGYITEKIIDCFYAGTIPLYLGAPDVDKYIPKECYIDCRDFKSWSEMLAKIRSMPASEIEAKREAGRSYLRSPEGRRFFNSFESILQLSEPAVTVSP